MACNYGAEADFAIGDANPIVTGSPAMSEGRILPIISESIAAVNQYVDANAMTGTRSHYGNRTQLGIIEVGGSFSCTPTSSDLAYLLPKILGTAASGTTYALADTLPNLVIQKRTGTSGNRVQTFPTNNITSATFSASTGGTLNLDCAVVGLSVTPGSTWPTLAFDQTNNIFVFENLALVIGGTTYAVSNFSLTVDNAVEVQRVNARAGTALYPTDRSIMLSCTIPEGDLLSATLQDATFAATATFTYSSQSLLFTLPAVRFAVGTPIISDRGEIQYPLSGQCFATSSARELEVTLDSTP